MLEGGHQGFVYSMKVGAPEDLAMILPIPVAVGAPENALKFISFEGNADFFSELDRGFPEPITRGYSKAPPLPAAAAAPLKVETVGSFVASFVPTVRDFNRLDAQFRLPETVWAGLGQYSKYGFAVFQLRKGAGPVHPMAFTFPTATPDRLFFPTVHIHDGKVHPKAKFDHALYCQPGRDGSSSLLQWRESDLPAERFVKVAQARGLVAADRHVYRTKMVGNLPNEDLWVRLA